MTTIDDLPFDYPSEANAAAPAPRACRHPRPFRRIHPPTGEGLCTRCGHTFAPAQQRKGRNNRARGGRAELDVARQLEGHKMGPLGLPWDVEVEGYMRLQVKKLAAWPSLNSVLAWIDAIPVSGAMRGAALIQAVGSGKRGRRLLVLDLDEYRAFHGDVLRQSDDDIQPPDPYLEREPVP